MYLRTYASVSTCVGDFQSSKPVCGRFEVQLETHRDKRNPKDVDHVQSVLQVNVQPIGVGVSGTRQQQGNTRQKGQVAFTTRSPSRQDAATLYLSTYKTFQ